MHVLMIIEFVVFSLFCGQPLVFPPPMGCFPWAGKRGGSGPETGGSVHEDDVGTPADTGAPDAQVALAEAKLKVPLTALACAKTTGLPREHDPHLCQPPP